MPNERNKKPGAIDDTGLSIPRMVVQPGVTSADLAPAADNYLRVVARVSTLALTPTLSSLLSLFAFDPCRLPDWTPFPSKGSFELEKSLQSCDARGEAIIPCGGDTGTGRLGRRT